MPTFFPPLLERYVIICFFIWGLLYNVFVFCQKGQKANKSAILGENGGK